MKTFSILLFIYIPFISIVSTRNHYNSGQVCIKMENLECHSFFYSSQCTPARMACISSVLDGIFGGKFLVEGKNEIYHSFYPFRPFHTSIHHENDRMVDIRRTLAITKADSFFLHSVAQRLYFFGILYVCCASIMFLTKKI